MIKLKLFNKQLDRSATMGLAEPSEAKFRFWALLFIGILGPPLLLATYFSVMFPGLTNPDALDFAQIARNLSSGKGFSTLILRPLALGEIPDPLRQPDVTHGPLYPFILAIAFGAFGARDGVVAGVSGIFYLLTIPLLYFLGLKLFNRQVALATALIFTFNALMLEYAASGLHITLYLFLATALMLAVYKLCVAHKASLAEDDNSLPKLPLAAVGALAALLYLTEPVFFWIMPVVVAASLAIVNKRRAAAAMWLLAPICLLAVPWMLRNYLLTGNPAFGIRGLEFWMYTKGRYPGLDAYRMAREAVIPSVGLFNAVVQKVLLGAGVVIQAFPQVTASWVLAFLLPSLLFRFTDENATTVRRIMVYCFVAILFGTLMFGIHMPLFVSLIPTMLVFSVAYLIHLIQQAQLGRRSVALVTALVATAVTFPLISDMFLRDKPVEIRQIARASELGELSGRSEVSLSDQPWIAAWYADRPSIWLPADDKQIGELRRRFKGLRWLFLTERSQGYSPGWQLVFQNLRSWNIMHAQRRKISQDSVQPVEITDTDIKLPLLTELKGFVSIGSPVADPLTSALAELPREKTAARTPEGESGR